MPTRYLRPGVRDSERIEAIQDPDAEIMYYRLLVTVDDFGRTDARAAMLKAACFPIRPRATTDKCMQWLQVLEQTRVLFTYSVDGKPYLQITKWENKARSQLSKFPDPPTDADKPRALADIPRASLPGTGTGTGTGTAARASRLNGNFSKFWEAYPKKKSKGDAEKAWISLNPDDALTKQILTAVASVADSEDWTKENRKYAPYPASWLRDKGWEDEVGGKPGWAGETI